MFIQLDRIEREEHSKQDQMQHRTIATDRVLSEWPANDWSDLDSEDE